MQTSTTPELTQFAEDVLAGLSSTPKSLSSKYFYDDEGTRLFQEIMKLPEYYLTNCEREIFEERSDEIFEDLIWSLSGFLGIDTFLGPFSLAYGAASSGQDEFYVSLGRNF